MVRWSDTAVCRRRSLWAAPAIVLVLVAGSRAHAQWSPAGLPANAKTPLSSIEPVPEFPQQRSDARLVHEGELKGTDRRDWRDAESRYAEGRWREAAEKLDDLITKHPDFAEGRVLRARCYARLGDAQKASVDLAAAIGADPRHVAAHELAGETALLAGDKATAIYEFRLALDASGSDAKSADRVLAVLFLARTVESEGYLAAAADLYEEFLEATTELSADMRRNDRLREMVETTGPELNRRIAAIRARLGEEAVAADAWRSVVREKPDDANAWRELAHAQARQGNADDAFESLRRFLALAQLGAGSVVELATLCELLPANADCDARAEAVVRSLGDADLSIQWAKRQLSAKRFGKAADLLVAAAKSHPDRADIRYLLAHVRANEGRAADAYEEIVAGSKLDTEPASTLLSMLRDDRDTFDLNGLLREAHAHTEAHPDDAMSHMIYATLLSASGQTDAAIEHYLKVTTGTPGYGAALAGLTDAYIEKMEWTAALDAASKAIDAGVKTGRIFYLKGLAHDALSQDVPAMEAFEAAGRCEPSDARLDAFMGMATIAERNGDRRTAERVYQKILADIDPNCAAACERLIVYYMNQGRYADAQRIFERIQQPLLVSPALVRCSAMIDLLAAVGQPPDKLLSDYLGKLRSILKDHPNDAATYIELATTYVRLSRFDEALAELESAVRVDPQNIKALEMKAEVHARLLDFAAAETVVDRLLRHRPRDLKYIQSKLDFANNRGATDSTIEMLRALIARDDLKEHQDRFTLQLVEELRAADRTDEAVRVAESWLNERPDDLLRRNLYLEVLSLAGRHDEAVQRARQYFEAAPTDRLAQIQLLANLQSAKRITEAMQLALSLLEKNPSDFDLTSAIIRLCWSGRRWDDAIEIARAAIEDTDQPGRYEQLLSLTFQHARRYDDAIEMRREQVRRYQKLMDRAQGAPHATSIALRLRQANYELINAMTAAGRYADAERLTESLLTPLVDDPGSSDAAYVMDLRNILSEIYRRSGQDEQAIEQLEEIYRMAPQDGGACNNLSYTLADTGRDVDRAEQLVRSSLAQDPNSSASLDTLGWVLYKQGKFDEAVYYLRRALRAAQFSDPVILDHLADTLYRLGDKPEANRCWENAMKFCDPEGDPPPTRDRVELYGVIQSKVAAVTANEAVETAPLAKDGPTTMPSAESAGTGAP
ncbi:MAG: tetratricopeptide repeat protein [Phycisphaerales bacterium]|nr:tetratricopeptide repeat protein [Phycisphaerales bacterium]MCB9856377.1 tetratricopeptide repeat protein [Phycisphaerales bacterium]MCB9864049.1 tetratricopeptide repeat protein [Phycisphaerales bacterium]